MRKGKMAPGEKIENFENQQFPIENKRLLMRQR